MTVTKHKPVEMSDEVKAMVQLRHSAEQRGEFEPQGRLQWMQTEHGTIRFPATVNGEGCGPDLALVQRFVKDVGALKEWEVPESDRGGALIVLGQWQGLPALRVNSSKPCPKCRHACDVCDGSGKKLCELCGGQTWLPGPFVPCPGPGCVRDTGGFAKGRIADNCATCRGNGHIPEHLPCTMCKGSKQMTCSRCQGTGKYSTGRVNGSVDWDVSPKCKACAGTCFVGKWEKQDVKKFANATLRQRLKRGKRDFFVVGPIREFAIRDPQTLRTRIFDVGQDAAGDFLVLLLPAGVTQFPKAYLVGGVVRERSQNAMSA